MGIDSGCLVPWGQINLLWTQADWGSRERLEIGSFNSWLLVPVCLRCVSFDDKKWNKRWKAFRLQQLAVGGSSQNRKNYIVMNGASIKYFGAAATHIAYQNDIPVLLFRSLSDLAGADQDGNARAVFFTVAAENAFTVTSAFINALYPDEEVVAPTDAPTPDESRAFKVSMSLVNTTLLGGLSFLCMV
jgi:hypothetical protein